MPHPPSSPRPAARREPPRPAPPAAAAPPPPRPASAAPLLTPGRRRLFAAITLALPVVLLGALELGLRAAGVGGSDPLFVPYDARPGFLHPNETFARRYFPAAGGFVPTPQQDFFHAVKPAGGLRLVFQGESSAQGFPYGHNGAPSRMLEQRLQAELPGRAVEVVNTALTAVNSYTLLDQADEILAQRPDAVLIYTGHNEYYGAFGAASPRSIARWRPLVRAWLALRELRTVQLLARAMGRAGAAAGGAATAGDADAPRTVMQLMAGEQRVPLGSAVYARGLAQFRANMGALLARYRAAGVPVLVGTVASNEADQFPLLATLAPGVDSAAWARPFEAGRAALARGDAPAAIAALGAALRLDSTAAAAHFLLGRARLLAGDTAAARASLRAAKEYDQLRFRAPEAINAIVREVAARQGATVVETQRALERASPGGIVGGSLMLEHLHPNADGYFLIADAFHDALRARRIGGDWPAAVPAAAARADLLLTPVDSIAAALRTDRLRSGWPFQPRGVTVVPAVDTLRPRTPAERLARAWVVGEMPWAAAIDRLRVEMERAGRPEEATRAARALAQEYRYSAQPYMDAARIAVGQRRWAEAAAFARAAAARGDTPQALTLAGLLLLRAGDPAAALPYLDRAAALAPGDGRARGAARAARLLPELEAGRRTDGRDPSLLYSLAAAYALTEQPERAREALDALFRVAPTHAAGRELARRLPPAGPTPAPGS